MKNGKLKEITDKLMDSVEDNIFANDMGDLSTDIALSSKNFRLFKKMVIGGIKESKIKHKKQWKLKIQRCKSPSDIQKILFMYPEFKKVMKILYETRIGRKLPSFIQLNFDEKRE